MCPAEKFRAPKGMRDILPPDIYIWQKLEKTAFEVFSRYGFREMRTPVVESTALFSRGIGEATDIVEKEMYTFEDKGGRSLTLRPEGTASAVRCYVENQLYNLPSPQKYYYWGPMFRYERPQAGRYRQFYQLGVEAFGSDSPALDAELLSMLRHFLLKSGLEGLNFQINSIGCRACRPDFIKALLEYLGAGLEGLCADCRRRYSANPLRILDCKASGCQELRKGAPRVTDHLCDGCHDHFDKFQHYLKLLDVPFSLNHEMVRGLDYYTRTTFEVTSENLGAQNAVTAGGRYDGLVREFGGPDTPAFGFAVGMERLVELLRQAPGQDVPRPGIFIAVIGERAHSEALLTAEVLRADGSWVEVGEHTASLKNQLRKADRLSAEYIFIIGDEELDAGSIKWKRLSDSASGSLPAAGVRSFLSGRR